LRACVPPVSAARTSIRYQQAEFLGIAFGDPTLGGRARLQQLAGLHHDIGALLVRPVTLVSTEPTVGLTVTL